MGGHLRWPPIYFAKIKNLLWWIYACNTSYSPTASRHRIFGCLVLRTCNVTYPDSRDFLFFNEGESLWYQVLSMSFLSGFALECRIQVAALRKNVMVLVRQERLVAPPATRTASPSNTKTEAASQRGGFLLTIYLFTSLYKKPAL